MQNGNNAKGLRHEAWIWGCFEGNTGKLQHRTWLHSSFFGVPAERWWIRSILMWMLRIQPPFWFTPGLENAFVPADRVWPQEYCFVSLKTFQINPACRRTLAHKDNNANAVVARQPITFECSQKQQYTICELWLSVQTLTQEDGVSPVLPNRKG